MAAQQPTSLDDIKQQLDRIELKLANQGVRHKQTLMFSLVEAGLVLVIAAGAVWWASLWTLFAVCAGFILGGFGWWKIRQLSKDLQDIPSPKGKKARRRNVKTTDDVQPKQS